MRHIYEPRSQAENTYRIIREQDHFHKGVLNDGSAKRAYPSGLYYAINALPYSDRVEIRSGNRIWSTVLPYLAEDFGIIGQINGPKSGVINSDYQLSDADIGRFVRWSNGQHYQITDVHVWQYNTFSTNRDVPDETISTAKIRGMICGLIFHRQLKWWVLQIDTRVFRARFDMAEWEEIPVTGITPNEARGEMKLLGDDVLLFNSAGLFKITLGSRPICYRLNESCPTAWPHKKAGYDGSDYYSRRYLLSYSRIPSAGFAYNRVSPGVSVQHQSGTNGPRVDDGVNIDWYEHRYSAPISADAPGTIYIYQAADPILSFTHYSLWGTLDTGPEGIELNNDPEQFWWLDDIPIMKTALVTACDGNVITVNCPFFHKRDKNVRIGSDLKSVVDVISETQAQLSSADTSLIDQACEVGSRKHATINQSEFTITRTDGDTWDAADVGKLLALSSGEFDWIRSVSSEGDSVVVTKSRSLSGASAVWEPTVWDYKDEIPDEELKLRDGFLLTQRWLMPLPSCNAGAVVPDFVAGIQSGKNKLYYSQRGDDTLIGYHHPGWQVQTCDEPIVVLSSFQHALVGYSKNGYSIWDLSAVQVINKNDNVESKTVPLGLTPLAILLSRKFTPGHGVLSRGAVQKLSDGSDMVVTNLREYRIFNGHEWSKNLAADRIMKRLRKLNSYSAVHYDIEGGFIHWSTEGSL